MWVDKPDNEENKNQSTDTDEGPSVGSGAGGGGAQIQSSTTPATGTPSSMSPTPEAPKQQFGTIQDYFKGNKDQGEQLGQQFTSKLDTAKQQQQNTIGEAAANAENQVQANTIGLNTDLLNKTVADPTKTVNNQDDWSKFTQQWNAAYNGPESFESSDQYTKAAAAAQAAKDKATEASSTGGRQQILQDEFGVYGQGNKGLDEALIQQSGSFGDVGTKAKELNSLQDYLTAQSQNIQNKAQAAKATTEATKETTQNALLGDQGAVKQFSTDLQSKLQTAQDKINASKDLSAKYKNAIETGNAEQIKSALRDAGMNADDINKTADYLTATQNSFGDPSVLQGLYQFAPSTADLSKIASSDDYAKSQALSQLTGLQDVGGLNQANAGQAGSFNVANPTSTLNPGQIKTTLKDYLFSKQINKNQGSVLPNIDPSKIQPPANASAAAVKLVADTFSKPISQAGTYHEGSVYDAVDRVEKLAGLYKQGEITADEYSRYSEPLLSWAKQQYNSIAGSGSKPANSINPVLPRLNKLLPKTEGATQKPGVIGIPRTTITDPITGQVKQAY